MKYFDQIIQNHFGQLSQHELNIIRAYFREELLQKGDLFTREGKACNRLSIIQSGILRIYALWDGKEITQWISQEHDFITEAAGFFFDQNNRWSIQALTDVTLLSITKANYQNLCQALPQWNKMERHFIVKCFAMLEERVFSHLSMSAEERYQLYFEQNPELFNRVPLQYIASVLGMTAETFSRIRKRKTGNS